VRRSMSVIVTTGLALAVAAVVPATPAAAAAPGGTYVALPVQSRVVDTRTGAGGNRKGAVAAGHSFSARIAGVGAVPASGVGSVVVTLTAVSPSATGALLAYGATRPSTTSLQFMAGQPAVTSTAVVPLSSGRMTIANTSSRGTVQVVVDVSGYYRSGSASATDPGVFHPLAKASRLVDTRTGAGGNHKGALGAGRAIAATIGGKSGIPAGAGAVAVTIHVINATRSGSIIAYRPDEPRQNLALVHFSAGQRASGFAVLRLSGGRVELANTSSGSVDVIVDVAGWYNIGFAQTAAAFQTVVQTRAVSTSAAANATIAVRAGGVGGVPLSGVTAVLATVHVAGPTRNGGLQAWKYGVARPRSTTVLQFKAGQTVSDVVLIPLSSDGRFYLHNASGGSTKVVVDIDGYVPGTTLTPPTATATARYIRTITDTDVVPGGSNDLSALGAADAAAGYSFVLLDIGAQLNDRSGVALTGNDRRITYAHLVSAITTYLTGFATGGHTGRVAVGTNNSGDWSVYPAASRGADWATQVVGPLATAASAGVTVIGADDLEAGFASTEPQAEAWKSAFLGAFPAGADTKLIYNGSADFCPKTWTRNAACNFGWTYAKLYALAGGPRTEVLPQIYFGYMATEWAEINATGGGHLRFVGALTEHALDPGTLQPGQGWTALRRAVSSVTATPIGAAVADFQA
jgi:hypothetical protein